MDLEIQILSKLDLVLLLQLAGFVFAVTEDPYLLKEQRRILLIIAVMAFSLVIQNQLNCYLETNPANRAVRTAVRIYGYCISPVILVLFLKTLDVKRNRKFLWVLTAINTGIYVITFFAEIGFRVSEENHYLREFIGYSCYLLSICLMGVLLYESIVRYSRKKAADIVILLGCAALIISAVAADEVKNSNEPIRWVTIAIICCSTIYYFWFHLQLAHEHDRALVSEQRIQIMISQIQPHFLYNTLSTIQALCRIDPEKAFETTEKFGSYLRMNIESLSESNLIPFQKELEHTRIYADIEMMRFPYFHISYDIREDDFEVPALSVQPIVENAIRHGIRGQYNGQIQVSTASDERDYVITVSDNGRGFDPESLKTISGTHIGIRNVSERIEILCGGSLIIDSEIGKGSVVTIRIPRRKEKQ